MNIRYLPFALLIPLLLAGCRPEQPIPSPSGIHTSPPAPVSTPPTIRPPVLSAASEIVLTISNPQPFSGRAGDPKPDWPAWGASGFDVDSDGSIWIADSAAQPPRLLHYNETGDLAGSYSLEGLVVFPIDVAITSNAVWLLDLSGMPPQLVQLDRQGQAVSSYPMPQQAPTNVLNNLIAGENEELWITGAVGLQRLVSADGEVKLQKLPGLLFAGHTYSVAGSQVRVDETSIRVAAVQENAELLGFELVGAAPDGTFYVLSSEIQNGLSNSVDRIVQAFNPEGERLGLARLPKANLYSENDLVVDPSGRPVLMLFQPDHAVEFWRLGFTPALPAISAIPVRPSPSHAASLEPLSPAWPPDQPSVGASDLEIARNTLIAFFWHLSQSQYDLAVPLFGGDIQTYAENYPELKPGDYAGLWKFVCTGPTQWQCLPVGRVVSEEQVGPDEFTFTVEFVLPNGTRFQLGPCCGSNEAQMPTVWAFPFTVLKIEDLFRVMEGPMYVP